MAQNASRATPEASRKGRETVCFCFVHMRCENMTPSGKNYNTWQLSAAKWALWDSCVCHRKSGQLNGINKQAPRSELFFYWFVCPEAQFHSMCLGSYSAANNIRALAQICLSRRTDTHARTHTCTARSSSRISHTLEDRCFQACWKTRRRRTFIL